MWWWVLGVSVKTRTALTPSRAEQSAAAELVNKIKIKYIWGFLKLLIF